MKRNRSRSLALLVSGVLWSGLVQAQENSNSSGGDATGSGGTAAYSVGVVLYTSNSGSNGNIEQGIQFPYEIFITAIKETELNISLTAYPNPTIDKLSLEISQYNNENLLFQVLDLQGKLLNIGQITSKQTLIEFSNLPSATYFVNVLNEENKNIKSFKIIKR